MFLGALWYLCFLLEHSDKEQKSQHLFKLLLFVVNKDRHSLILEQDGRNTSQKISRLLVLAVLHERIFGINAAQHLLHRLLQPEHYHRLLPQAVRSPHIQSCELSQSWWLPGNRSLVRVRPLITCCSRSGYTVWTDQFQNAAFL